MVIIQGIHITVLGMAILFAALLILMLAAMGLERLFRPREPKKEERSGNEKELVAAIAVALASELKAQSSKPKYPVVNIQYQPSDGATSPWKLHGRQRQLMGSRQVKGRRG